VGNDTGDDAAVYKINDQTALILTVDFLTPITDDPYEFGSIAAANSLSDVYAMGGKPLLALNVVGFPADLAKDMLADVLLGGHDKATEAGCMIVGGHTVDDAEPKYGLSVVGIVEPGKQTSNAGAQPGDHLILTKPIGTGIIATGAKQQNVDPDVMKNAVQTMTTLNKAAAEAMMEVGVNSCTDVTGFGLMGHLRGMVKASKVAAQIRYSDVPLLPGAWELLNQGVVPGGTYRNMQQVADTVLWNEEITEEQKLMLCDAQTSGGLLISVPGSKANELLIRLQAAGVPISALVGKITGGPAGTIEVIP
jgi:selenide,water dikinase